MSAVVDHRRDRADRGVDDGAGARDRLDPAEGIERDRAVDVTGGGEPVANLAGNTGGTEAIAFDPHGELLAAGGPDRVIRVYRTGDLAQIAELPGPTGDIRPAGAASAITPPQDHATGSASPPVR